MNQKTLKKANELNHEIKIIEQAISYMSQKDPEVILRVRLDPADGSHKKIDLELEDGVIKKLTSFLTEELSPLKKEFREL